MNALAVIALIAWPFTALALFALLRAQLAVLVTFVVGFLFLPVGQFELSGLPEYNKFTAIALGALLGATAFDAARLRTYRLGLVDLPMLLWCTFVPIATSLSNGLGAYDGFAACFDRVVLWGVPFLLGRVYFRDARSLRRLAVAFIVAGMLYVPLCLWEIRMSPQLHAQIYGFHQRPFLYLIRYEGYRPIVFLQSSLAVGMVMASAAIASYWLVRSGAKRQLRGIPIWGCFAMLAATVVLGKTSAAISLVVVGVALFTAFRMRLGRLAFLCLLLMVAAYPLLRLSGALEKERILVVAEQIYPAERVRSLGVRLHSEELMAEKAFRQPAFGWGGYGRGEVQTPEGRRIAIPDGLWIIALSQNGLVGLLSLMAMYLLPPALFLLRHADRRWTHPAIAPVSAISIVLLLYWVDSLANAMPNPVFFLGMGGLTGHHAQRARSRRDLRAPAPVVDESVARA